MAERIILKGAVGYEPLCQGALDGLCGVYATINAICIVLKPQRALRSKEVKWLMKSATRHLDQEQALRKAFNGGMTAKRQQRLARHLLAAVSVRIGIKLSARMLSYVQQGATQGELLQAIESSLRKGAAVVIRLQNHHNHFTVVVGCSATRLYLADSDGLHWLSKKHFGLCDDEDLYRNCVYLSEVFEISPS
jgi:hypothetical protein